MYVIVFSWTCMVNSTNTVHVHVKVQAQVLIIVTLAPFTWYLYLEGRKPNP